MSVFKETFQEILALISRIPSEIETKQVDILCGMLIEAWSWGKLILVTGAGRSGLVGKGFAMRLMHLGFRTSVVGETITPAIGANDVLLAISGSGTTGLVVATAEAAKKMGAKIIALTSIKESPLTKMADHVVIIPGRPKTSVEPDYFSRQILGIHEPLAPLGTLFEISTMVVLDSIIVELMHRLGKTEKEMQMRHATIE